MNLLFVAEELAINGASMSLLALLNALTPDKYNVSLFVMNHAGCIMDRVPTHVNVLPERLCYSVHRLPLRIALRKAMNKGRLDLILYRILVSCQRAFNLNYYLWPFLSEIKEKYDVVCSYEDGFTVPMIVKKVRYGKKCSWVHIPYSHWPQLPFVLDAFNHVDACVPVSEYVGKDLIDTIGHQTSPHYVVHNIVDAEFCKERAKDACEYPKIKSIMRIVSVGRITSAKGFEIIPEVAKALELKGILFEWFIIGGGQDQEKLQQEANEKCRNNKVLFVGSKSNPMPLVKSADVVVQPSTFESWGMMVSEALCLGKAVVATNIPAFGEQIKDGENGFLRPYNSSSLASAIMEILTNNELRHRLEKNAECYPFTKAHVIREFENMLFHLFD